MGTEDLRSMKRNPTDGIGEVKMKERKNRLRDEVTKAMAQLVRHRHRGQVRFEQQHLWKIWKAKEI